MKRRIIVNDSDLWEAIRDTRSDHFQAGQLSISEYETTGLGMTGHFTIIELPEVSIVHSTANLPYDLGINVTISHPLIQMHFGLTGYEYSTIGKINQLHVYRNQHNLFYLPPGQKDFLKHGASQNYITFEVNFRPSYLFRLLNGNFSMISEFYKRMESGDAALLGKDSKPITGEMHHIIRAILACRLPDPLRQIYLETKVQELFILQVQQFCEEAGTALVKLHSTDKEKLHQIRELIEGKLDMPYSLTELAAEYGLNIDKLKKGYKQLFGSTVFGHLHGLKMQNARKMLVEGEYSVAEIAALTGYKNPQHFTKAFKESFGVLPKQLKGYNRT